MLAYLAIKNVMVKYLAILLSKFVPTATWHNYAVPFFVKTALRSGNLSL